MLCQPLSQIIMHSEYMLFLHNKSFIWTLHHLMYSQVSHTHTHTHTTTHGTDIWVWIHMNLSYELIMQRQFYSYSGFIN